MLSAEFAATAHQLVEMCAVTHSYMPKIQRQLSVPPGNVLEPLMYTSTVLPLEMVPPQLLDWKTTTMDMVHVTWNIVDQTTAAVW